MISDERPGGDAGFLASVHSRNARRAHRARDFALAALVLGFAGGVAAGLRSGSTRNGWLGVFCAALPLSVVALVCARRAETKIVDVDGPEPDELEARRARRIALAGIVVATALVAGLAVWASWDGLVDVANTFFSWEHISGSFSNVLEGFWLNVQIFFWAEILVLGWGLLVVTVRQLPGRAAAPLRWLSVVYVDVFRGLPAIVTIYLIGFGLPLTDLPVIAHPSVDLGFVAYDELTCLGILALVLVYGAYVAEVYRAGIESVHWSQSAAARGLGLSRGQTLRFVVVPQAVRRVIPPLMNDFIGLQKDTALLNVLGILEGFNLARIYAGNNFNLSSVTGLGLCFLVITIPMTRFTDYLVRRDQQRMQAGAG